jgi:hypothetical protein
MEMTITRGVRYFPQYGPFAVSGGVQSERLRWSFAGRPFHPAPINPTGIDLQTTDRVRMSASEP